MLDGLGEERTRINAPGEPASVDTPADSDLAGQLDVDNRPGHNGTPMGHTCRRFATAHKTPR